MNDAAIAPRLIDPLLSELVGELPAFAVRGAKGVGKTVSASRHATTVIALEDPVTRSAIDADPSRVVGQLGTILIDEWQRVPAVWDLVRRAVDAGAESGRFLLTGSDADPSIPLHSGAGRIVTLTMRPMLLAERGAAEPTVSVRALLRGDATIAGSSSLQPADYAVEICRSGFPGIAQRAERARQHLLDGYVSFIVEREVREAGIAMRRPDLLRRWLTGYAAADATVASFESIRAAATAAEGDKPSLPTTQPYREALTRLGIIEPIPAWLPGTSPLTRLAKSVKHHVVDPALSARLLGLGANHLADLRGATQMGQLFESLVAQHLLVLAELTDTRVHHLRTRNGDHEVDFILERRDGRVLAVEVKSGRVIRDDDVRNLNWLRDRIGPQFIDGVVISAGPEAYRRKDGIAVIPLGLLGV